MLSLGVDVRSDGVDGAASSGWRFALGSGVVAVYDGYDVVGFRIVDSLDLPVALLLAALSEASEEVEL